MIYAVITVAVMGNKYRQPKDAIAVKQPSLTYLEMQLFSVWRNYGWITLKR